MTSIYVADSYHDIYSFIGWVHERVLIKAVLLLAFCWYMYMYILYEHNFYGLVQTILVWTEDEWVYEKGIFKKCYKSFKKLFWNIFLEIIFF